MNQEQFQRILDKYGAVASWAIWNPMDVTDLSIIHNNIHLLHTEIVFVALNISKEIEYPFANFHRTRNDEKLHYALIGSRLYGSYLTDVIKGFMEPKSFVLKKMLTDSIEKKHINYFLNELNDIGGNTKLIIAIGDEAYRILTNHLGNKYQIKKITHYSYRFAGCSDPSIYAERVKKELQVAKV